MLGGLLRLPRGVSGGCAKGLEDVLQGLGKAILILILILILIIN